MFLSAVLTPIFLALGFAVDGPGPLLIPMLAFFIGLALLFYSRFFLEDVPLVQAQPQPYRFPDMQNNALPPASNMGTNVVGGKQVRTSELAQPASVTEHTTKLLNND